VAQKEEASRSKGGGTVAGSACMQTEKQAELAASLAFSTGCCRGEYKKNAQKY
jgi:hypothetical protein